jgi:glucose/arabinose dehydrogenase
VKFHWFIIVIILVASGSFIQCTPLNKSIANDSDNGGLYLPSNFEAQVVVESIQEKARHITVADNGAVYVNLRYSKKDKSIGILLDTTLDGKADIIKKFGNDTKGPFGKKSSYATAIRIYDGYLYVSSELVIYRYKLIQGSLLPETEPEIILTDDHEHGIHHHIGKPITFDDKGFMYVPFGGPSNACQEIERTPRSKGYDPCPQLEDHGGIWRFDPNKLEQTQKDGTKFATGIRSVIALDWNHDDGNLYAVVHGRDDLMRIFPEKYGPWESAMLPSEQFIKITEGSDFGWPYCYYDQLQKKKVLSPEYGGDGKIIGRCDQYEGPILGFPGHWAPNDLVFYTGNQFPDRYKNGAFIAFHGSSNRAPYPQSGYFVAFSPFVNGKCTGEWEVFADGFAQVDPIVSVKDAVYRPMGLSVGPKGSLFIADTEEGKVWKVNYTGDKNDFGEEQLAAME